MQPIIKLLLCSLLCCPLQAAYSFNRTITIDHTKVPNADQTDFPITFYGTYNGSGSLVPDLRTVANGGKVQNASGFDIGFFSASDCSTGKLKWETELYTATTGVVVYWIKIATLSHATNKVIYLCYGDASITTDQSDPTNVWDSNYKIVSHYPNGTSLTVLDSTANAYNGTNASATAGTGLMDGAGVFTQSGTRVTYPNNADTASSTFTASAWVFETGDPHVTNGEGVFGKWNANGWMVFVDGAGGSLGAIKVFINNTGFNTGATLTKNAWHYLVVSFDGTNIKFYLDNGAAATSTGSMTANTVVMEISSYLGGVPNTGVTGNIDEYHFSTSIRDVNWKDTEYNNQSSPSTFYAIGTESGGGSHRSMKLIIQ